MSFVLIQFPDFNDLMRAINISALLTTHSVLLEWLYDIYILGRGYNWVFTKYNADFFTAGHISAIYIFMYTILQTQFRWTKVGHCIVQYVVITVWMNILTGYMKMQVVISLTPMHPPTKLRGALNQKTTIWNFLSFQLYYVIEVKGWCGKVHNLFTTCYVAVMLQFHIVDYTI